jgi:hypothetical protein
MRRTHGALTVLTVVRPGASDALREVLARIDADVEDNALVPFKAITSVHFARWAILPAATDAAGAPIAEQLLFATSHDLPTEDHLADLLTRAARGIDEVYRHCEGYPAAEDRTRESRWAYLIAHAVDTDTLYVGAPELSVARIHAEGRLRERVEDLLDGPGAGDADSPSVAGDPEDTRPARNWSRWTGHTADDVRSAVRTHVAATDAWALESPGPRIRALGVLGWVALAGLGLLLVPLILLWLLLARVHEALDERRGLTGPQDAVAEADSPAQGAHVRAVAAREDQIVQNQMTHVVSVKPGWFRRASLRLVLALLDFGGRNVYNQGELFGVSTLHFVRWVRIDGGRRLLFVTNYDGAMTGYVSDFVQKSWQVPSALTAIWTHTVGFPRTRFLVLQGARDVDLFTAFLRGHQVETQVWYSAYKRLTTANLVNNARIRRGLSDTLDPGAVGAWLGRL